MYINCINIHQRYIYIPLMYIALIYIIIDDVYYLMYIAFIHQRCIYIPLMYINAIIYTFDVY